ncbi:MAG: UDP-glucose 4-epimerase GalE [Candidatus Aureabacteria bacterium]|nr:UDP-glucose 4-epimerase GalE [Candidatus Auribacterota bacterium]
MAGPGNILVTGGAGYIGSHMARYLIEKEEKPVVLDNLSTGYREFVPHDVPFFKGDLRNPQDVARLFQQFPIQYVMHFAAQSIVTESLEKPLEYYENNILGCLNLLKECVSHSVKGFIFSSTAAVYGEPEHIPIREESLLRPVNPYGQTKLVCECMLNDASRRFGLPVVSLRYFNAAGAHPSAEIGEKHPQETHLVPNIISSVLGVQKELCIFGDDYPTADGTCVRDFIYVCDLCEAHYLALGALREKKAAGIFNLGSGKGYSVKEIIRLAEKITQREIPVRVAVRRPGDPARLVADFSRAKKVLSWEPKADMRVMIETSWRFAGNDLESRRTQGKHMKEEDIKESL